MPSKSMLAENCVCLRKQLRRCYSDRLKTLILYSQKFRRTKVPSSEKWRHWPLFSPCPPDVTPVPAGGTRHRDAGSGTSLLLDQGPRRDAPKRPQGLVALLKITSEPPLTKMKMMTVMMMTATMTPLLARVYAVDHSRQDGG